MAADKSFLLNVSVLCVIPLNFFAHDAPGCLQEPLRRIMIKVYTYLPTAGRIHRVTHLANWSMLRLVDAPGSEHEHRKQHLYCERKPSSFPPSVFNPPPPPSLMLARFA